MELPFDISSILQNVSKVSLKGGVVGKVSITVMVVALAMAAISWSVRDFWLGLIALIFVFLLAFVMLWRLINFAGKYPEAALLEGSELLVMKRMEIERLGSDIKQIDATIVEQQIPVESVKENLLLDTPPSEEEHK